MPLRPLRPGDLRTKIEILRPVEADDGHGADETSGWTIVATPWAEVQGQDGREALIGQAIQGISTYRIRIRWRAGIGTGDQVRLGGAGGTDLNITSATDPNGDREQLMIIATNASARATS